MIDISIMTFIRLEVEEQGHRRFRVMSDLHPYDSLLLLS